MRYFYAQIDGTGRCVGVIDTHQPIDAAHMVAVASMDITLLGRYWNGSAWQDAPIA